MRFHSFLLTLVQRKNGCDVWRLASSIGIYLVTDEKKDTTVRPQKGYKDNLLIYWTNWICQFSSSCYCYFWQAIKTIERTVKACRLLRSATASIERLVVQPEIITPIVRAKMIKQPCYCKATMAVNYEGRSRHQKNFYLRVLITSFANIHRLDF